MVVRDRLGYFVKMEKNLLDALRAPNPSAVAIGAALRKLLVGRAANLKEQLAVLVEVVIGRDERVAVGAVRFVEGAAFEIAVVAAELSRLYRRS